MSERFFLPTELAVPEIVLAGSEAHHLARVLRLGPGQEVVVFDGRGAEVDAVIESVSKREVRLRPGPVRRPESALALSVTLAVAPPKGDRFRWLVEKATELGVARLIPILTERSVVDPRDGKLEKLRQTMIAACKQSGRCRLMELTDPVSFDEMWGGGGMPSRERRHVAGNDANGTVPGQVDAVNPPCMPPGEPSLVILQPGHRSLVEVLSEEVRGELLLLIGPEGGFTDAEVERALRAGAGMASLGGTILRTETAAVAAAAVAGQFFE